MACKAIKNNFGLCRSWSSLDSDFCHAHAKMTPEIYKERWFKRYILGFRPDGNEVFRFRFYCPNQWKKDILTPLQSGEIKLSSKDIASIPAKDRYVDILVLLLEHGFADEKDNVQLITRAFAYIVRSHLYRHELNIEQFYSRNMLAQKIEAILKSRARSLAAFVYTLPDVLGVMGAISNTQGIFCPMLTDLLESDAGKELSWLPKTGTMVKRYEMTEIGREYLPFLQSRWLPELNEIYHTEKQIQKAKTDHFKEELMMNRWHPDRVWKYLEMGIEMEDM